MTHWPLRDLILRTPCLELRPDDDEGLRELVDVAYAGVHPSEEMPFLVPWTEADPGFMGRGMLQYYWSARATVAPERWKLNFLVRLDGRGGCPGPRRDGLRRHPSGGEWVLVGAGPPGLRVEGVDGMLGLLGAG